VLTSLLIPIFSGFWELTIPGLELESCVLWLRPVARQLEKRWFQMLRQRAS
jgi:hypothetical protein